MVDGNTVRVFRCGNCGVEQEEEPSYRPSRPKVLYVDIETALMGALIFSPYIHSKRIRIEQVIQRSYVICWAAAWVNDDEFLPVLSGRVREQEAREYTDRRNLERVWELMDSADYVVGHNSDGFDIKKLHYRFEVNGMGLPYKFKQIDTLKQARKYYGADSNKLDEWIKLFGGIPKHDMSEEDWQEIYLNPTAERLEKMEDYCRNDVRQGVMVYRRFRREIEGRGDVVLK